ncbi:uncharacterized protein B0I36DRAFT_26028 [Microdochium trichocladiopsis]|uniref:Uncharacterized protein n=1 Tax=Microdochium trichocladiopsis TaxID=1682393 RepID=A0A9P8XUU2_9PEZI|nr:uncharacterized protein B0I36DRAFT_26028 [Microdochium trichocladiopsis]KAH7020851.1 hypothetical protein B0I36DRAFT_26028 [Microdochium trichocladiopsis]
MTNGGCQGPCLYAKEFAEKWCFDVDRRPHGITLACGYLLLVLVLHRLMQAAYLRPPTPRGDVPSPPSAAIHRQIPGGENPQPVISQSHLLSFNLSAAGPFPDRGNVTLGLTLRLPRGDDLACLASLTGTREDLVLQGPLSCDATVRPAGTCVPATHSVWMVCDQSGYGRSPTTKRGAI